MTTLNEQLLTEIGRLHTHLVGCVSCSTCEATAGYRALRAVVELCESRMAEAVGGGLTDVGTIWPTEILRAIADELS